jgi:hypothetical protein
VLEDTRRRHCWAAAGFQGAPWGAYLRSLSFLLLNVTPVVLAGRRQHYCRRVVGRVVEVDFFDEANGQLVVGEPDVGAGVHAG